MSESLSRTTFSAGGSGIDHAQFIALMLIASARTGYTPSPSTPAIKEAMLDPHLVVRQREKPAPADHDGWRQQIRTPE
jgi:hypothetical protein